MFSATAFPCPLLVEFALATLKIALNGPNLRFLLPLITGNLVPLISGLYRFADTLQRYCRLE
jgi:hypothetical protein